MSMPGRSPIGKAVDVVERLREAHREPPALAEILESAYALSDIDTATVFAFCRNELSPEERREVEAEALADPRFFEKLTRIAAHVGRAAAELDATPGERVWEDAVTRGGIERPDRGAGYSR